MVFFWRYQNLLRVGFILKSIVKQGRKSNSFHYVLGFFFFFSCFSFVSISGTLNKIDGVSYDIWFYNRITKWQNRISSKYAKVLETNVVFKIHVHVCDAYLVLSMICRKKNNELWICIVFFLRYWTIIAVLIVHAFVCARLFYD